MVPELEPFRQAMTAAWVSKGQSLTEDVYSGEQLGLVKCMSTIYKGVRSTSAVFLDGHPNITLVATAQAKNLVISGDTVTGVVVYKTNGEEVTFTAKKEVIVSCGVFESPKLLMLSGIGPEKELKEHGIKSVIQSEHVGQNLLDHPILAHVFRLKDGYGLDGHLLRAGPMKEAAVAAYRKNRTGPYHSGLLELVGFPRIDDYLMTDKSYRARKQANGGVDPFGPANQPHFEVDFVVSYSELDMSNLLTVCSPCSAMLSSGTFLHHRRETQSL